MAGRPGPAGVRARRAARARRVGADGGAARRCAGARARAARPRQRGAWSAPEATGPGGSWTRSRCSACWSTPTRATPSFPTGCAPTSARSSAGHVTAEELAQTGERADATVAMRRAGHRDRRPAARAPHVAVGRRGPALRAAARLRASQPAAAAGARAPSRPSAPSSRTTPAPRRCAPASSPSTPTPDPRRAAPRSRAPSRGVHRQLRRHARQEPMGGPASRSASPACPSAATAAGCSPTSSSTRCGSRAATRRLFDLAAFAGGGPVSVFGEWAPIRR